MRETLDDILDEYQQTEISDGRVAAFNPQMAADRAREASRLAKKYSFAIPVVEADFDQFKQADRMDQAEEAMQSSPWLRSQISAKPDTARLMATDDFRKLGGLANDLRILEERNKPKPRLSWTAARAGELALKTVGSVGVGAAEGVAGVLEAVVDSVGFNEKSQDYFNNVRSRINVDRKNTTPEWLGQVRGATAIQAGGTSLGLMLAAATAGRAKVLPILVGLTFGGEYSKFQGRGETVGASLLGASASAGIEYGTEKVGLKYLFGDGFAKEGLKAFGQRVGNYLVSDVIGEQIATLGQDAVDVAMPMSGKTWADYINERPQAALDTLGATLVMGGGIGAIGLAARRFRGAVSEAQASVEGLGGQAILDDLMTKAEDIEFRKNAPDEFAATVTAASNSIKEIYIPMEAVDAVLADETISDEDKAVLTFYQDQFDDARVANGEIVVPIGEAVAKLAGSKVYQAVRDEVRVQAGGKSAKEAREQINAEISNLESIGNAALAEIADATPAFEAKAKVYQEVKGQVMAAGRSEREAQTTAAIYASRAETLASPRYGQFKSIEDAWAWQKVQIQSETAAPPRATAPTVAPVAGVPAPAGAAPTTQAAGQTTQQQVGASYEQGQRSREYAPLDGSPKNGSGPIAPLVNVAKRVSEKLGVSHKRQAEYVQVDVEFAKRIADAYEAMEHNPRDPVVAEAYQNLIRQTREQYDALVEDGYSFTFFSDDSDPYDGNPWNAMRDLAATKSMAVYATSSGYGSEVKVDLAENPMLAPTGLQWPDQSGTMQPVLANDLFRAVHDAFGHGLEGAGFRAQGEENAWQAHARLFTGSALAALTTETRGQNSWLNYGPFGEANYNALLEDTIFADQKVGLLPEWAWTENVAGDRIDAPPAGATLYHGTPFAFDTFAENGKPVWLSESAALASDYANSRRVGRTSGSRIIPVQVDIRNPLDVDAAAPANGTIEDPVAWARESFGFELADYGWDRTGPDSVYNVTRSAAFAQAAREAGYDAIAATEGSAMTWGVLKQNTVTSAIDPDYTLYQSSIDLLDNEQSSSVQGALAVARSQKFANQREFKLALQKMVNAYKGNKRDRKRLMRLALNDARVALVNNANAVGWYNEKVSQALSVFATIHPEIATDPDAKFAFVYALAVTSNGLKVDRNFKLADIVYRKFKETGQMPIIGEGTASKAMQGSLAQFNVLVEQFGMQGLRNLMLRDDITVKELEAVTGVKVGGEHKGTTVTGAAFLGAKIGNGFFSNLYGNFDQLTMDRWFIRTWGRWTGTLITEDKAKIKAGREKVATLLRSLTPAQRKAAEAALNYKIKLSDIDGFTKRVTNATSSKAVRDALDAIHPRLRLEPKNFYLFLDGQKEAPQGPAERNEIRSIMQPVLAELQADNPELTMADLQAVLWYPEKTLYVTATSKVGADTSEGYADDEAPDYANAAVALAKAEGVAQDKIDEALEAGRTRVQTANGTGRAERDTGTVFAEDESGFPLEEVFSSEGDGNLDPTATYQQGPRGEATLGADGSGAIITLFKTADFSTLVHETSHVFLQQEFALAQMEGASDELKADVDKLKAWMTKNGGGFDAKGMPDRNSHELFARTGERYFREGIAPSAELRGTFAQYGKWLKDVYTTLKKLTAAGPAPINPEIAQIMDRMIATQEAIDDNAKGALSRIDLGMEEDEYSRYEAAVQAGVDRAHDTLLGRMMRAVRMKETAKGLIQRANIRAEVEKEVNSDPAFIALHLLRTNRWLDDPTRPSPDIPIKINTGWLIDNYGEEILGQLPVGLQPLHKGDGIDGSLIAEMVGISSGDALVKALTELKLAAIEGKKRDSRPLKNQIVEDEVDRIMAERHGDPALSEEDIREEAIAALNSEAQGKLFAEELRQLQKKSGRKGEVTPYQLLREWARNKANQSTVKDALSKAVLQRYVRNYDKATKAVEAALVAGDTVEATKQKQAQMINHAALAEAKIALDSVTSMVRRLRRIAKTKALGSVDQDYMDRSHELLEAYGFRTPSQRPDDYVSFENWAAAETAKGFEVYTPNGFRDSAGPFEEVTVEKLIELFDMVSSLQALGRKKQKLETIEEKRVLKELVADIRGRVLNLPGRKLGEGLEEKSNVLRRAASELVKVEGMADILDGTSDGTGPMNKVLIRPATEAANKYSRIWEEVMAPIVLSMAKLSRKEKKRLEQTVTLVGLNRNVSIDEADPRIGEPMVVTRMQLLGMLANTGNLSNLAKMVDGEKWGNSESASELAEVRATLLSYATKEDMDLVQSMWDGVAKLWPYIAETERTLSGIVPEQVVPMEFEAFGAMYTGGYWPVVWDSARSDMGRKIEDETTGMLEGVGFGIGTPKGHTITRTGASAPMEYRLDAVLSGHLNKVVSRIAYAPWIRDALRVVNSGGVTGAIDMQLGREYTSKIKPWLRDQIPSNAPDYASAKWWAGWVDKARVNMSIAVLGVSYTTGVAQLLGLGYSAGILGDGNVKDGAKWMSVGMFEALRLNKYIGNQGENGVQAFVFSRSQEMSRRAQEVNREVVDVMQKLRDTDTVVARLQAAAFWHIGFIDLNMVAIPTWLGAYKKAQSQGLSEPDAIAYAEKAVRKSQGSGRQKDLSSIQRGGPAEKFVTMFYTPSSVFFNQQWEATQQIKAGNWSKALAPTFWFMVMTSLANAMREGDWPEDDEEEGDGVGADDVGMWAVRNIAFEGFYGTPGLRDAANYGERQMRGEYAPELMGTPISAMGAAVKRGGNSFATLFDEEKDIEGRDIKNMANAVGFTLGLPTNQPGKSAQFLYDVNNEAAEPVTLYDWYKGLAYGKLPEEQGE